MSVQQFPRRPGRPGTTFLALLFVLPTPIAPAIITVSGDCTLVDAITAANTDTATGSCPAGSGADEIHLTEDVTLTGVDNENYGPNGLPLITTEVTVEGNGFTIGRSTIGATPPFRIFYVDSAGTLVLNRVTVANGEAGNKQAGGVYSLGDVYLSNSAVIGNSASTGAGITNDGGVLMVTSTLLSGNSGGAIETFGTVTLTDSIVSANSSTEGGIRTLGPGTVTITRSTITNNVGGGILHQEGVVILDSSTISGNTGGIENWDTVILNNSTVSGEWPSGIRTFEATLTVNSSTFSDNGIGIDNDDGSVSIVNSILGKNSTGNCSGVIDNAGNNLADDTTCGTIPDTLTGLEGRLRDNGGPTMTHALLTGSNARDAGSDADCPATDQRGAARVGTCDIGAFEYVPCPDLVLSSEIISGTETRENCQAIVAGPDFSVAGTGDLTLRAGKTIMLEDSTSVDPAGQLTLEIEPDLQLVPP